MKNNKKIILCLPVLLALMAAPQAARAITRCDVLEDAQSWVDAGVAYGWGPGAEYCPSPYYCDPMRAGECYRPDCSGFVSAVWGLSGPGHTTYSFAGGPWDDGVSEVITAEELEPGDALNYPGNPSAGTGHIMLYMSGDFWSGYVDVYEEYSCGHFAERRWRTIDTGRYVPIRYINIEPCFEPLDQVNGNESIALVSWPDDGAWPNDGHPEVFAVTPAGAMVHLYPHGHGDDWSGPLTLDDGAACGFATGFWPTPKNYPEIFTPTPAGGTAHLWLQSGEWTAFADLGGSSMEHMSTVAWADGRVEVFALGPDNALWHNWWMGDDLLWSGWESLEGSFATGASAIAWEDGHVELFAADADGHAWHNWSGDFPTGWNGWGMLEGEIASRPVPVRWPDGHVEVFARGADGHVQHCWYGEGVWTVFVTESAGTTIEGEPSVAMNPDGAGTPAGPAVGARGTDGKVLHLWWDGAVYRSLEPLGDQAAASDPFVWKREDGTMEVFVIDPGGRLRHIRRDIEKNWGSWSTLGEGFDPCVADEPEPVPEPVPETEPDAAVDAIPDMPAEADALEDAPTVEDAVGDADTDDGSHEVGPAGGCGCEFVGP